MLVVVLSAVSSIVSVKLALRDQLYSKMSRSAGDAGLAYAQACLESGTNDFKPKWTTESPLMPNTSCDGTLIVDCDISPNDDRCWVSKDSVNNIRTSFSVPLSTVDADGRATGISSIGIANLIRQSNSSVWRRYTQSNRLNRIVPRNQEISSGEIHTCSIASDIQVYCWGRNGNGQLGNNSTTNSSTPVPIYNGGYLLGKTIKSVSVGDFHACLIASDSQAYCWGRNSDGALGDGTNTERHVPTPIDMTGVLSGKTIKSISAAEFHTCAIASDDKAYCWGNNLYGKLGNGTTVNSNSPVAVDTTGVLTGKTIKSIASGYYHTCAIASDNKAYCWGNNDNGRLGNGNNVQSSVPVAVDTTGVLNGKVVKFISTGNAHTCTVASVDIVSNGDAYCWGYNSSGQLGDNTASTKYSAVAVVNTGALNGLKVKYLSSNNVHTCAIASDNKTYCWGDNYYGQLGDNTNTQRLTPVAVHVAGVLNGKSIVAVSGGDYHTCSIDIDSKSYCWGYNFYGQLGDNTTLDRIAPVLVNNLPFKLFYY